MKPDQTDSTVYPESKTITDRDLYLFNEGRHYRSYRFLGAHLRNKGEKKGAHFSVWAPSARAVSVIGDFNSWKKNVHPLSCLGDSGIWEGFVERAMEGHSYKFHIQGKNGFVADKADPFAFFSETPPNTASKLWNLNYKWRDSEWMAVRKSQQAVDQPMSIYEVHLGSWKRGENNRFLTYRDIAKILPDYLLDMGFTHVEFLPIMEHPFYGSWGYQTTGYFAPTSRFGSPQDFMFLVDELHLKGLGVILDWVPSHFPSDAFSLGYFEGSHLFEHADARQGFHPDWNSLIFNYGRHEVKSFLISSAMFWLDLYHVDAIRVDAVASMLYLDYSRKEGEWIPNIYGGRENLDAISFLRQLNETIYLEHPDVHTIAEESTAWPRVSSPTYIGGLGFGMKWDLGWMHDTLEYFKKEPVHRKYHQDQLTFRMVYAFNEKFVIPLSHDEVVHGKGSLFNRMPGDKWQKFANLRTLYAYLYAQPGKKLLFMGAEFGQIAEWNHERSLDWHLLDQPGHEFHLKLKKLVQDLNRIYLQEVALHQLDFSNEGFDWLDTKDSQNSVISFFRKGKEGEEILCVFNLTPVPRFNYRLGVSNAGIWDEVLNTDAIEYGGSGLGNLSLSKTNPYPSHGRPHSLTLTLPPLAALFLKFRDDEN